MLQGTLDQLDLLRKREHSGSSRDSGYSSYLTSGLKLPPNVFATSKASDLLQQTVESSKLLNVLNGTNPAKYVKESANLFSNISIMKKNGLCMDNRHDINPAHISDNSQIFSNNRTISPVLSEYNSQNLHVDFGKIGPSIPAFDQNNYNNDDIWANKDPSFMVSNNSGINVVPNIILPAANLNPKMSFPNGKVPVASFDRNSQNVLN